MSSPEQQTTSAADLEEVAALVAKRSSSLIYGSAEMLEAAQKLARFRAIRLGEGLSQLVLEFSPVPEASEA